MRWRSDRAHQEMYPQLSEAMDCLQHICTEGCTGVAPLAATSDEERKVDPCTRSTTCQQLQVLIRHFATCSKKLEAKGCTHCRRMHQLFRLHASICVLHSCCKVPFCTRLKSKMQRSDEDTITRDESTWRLLVKKVVAARVMSSLASRRRPEQVQLVHKSRLKHRGASLNH